MQNPARDEFAPVCAIGASAGGVAALQGLFRALPADLGFAYVVVIHLAPDQPSALEQILGGCTRMPVLTANDTTPLLRDRVYVIPPKRELVIEDARLRTRPFEAPRGRRTPIDLFLRSLAAHRGAAVALVLSGTGADGAEGVRAVKRAGGVVMAQEPAEAAFAAMPQNAIATGAVDFVGPLSRLAERLAELSHSREAVRSLDRNDDANDLRRIVAFLRARTGHDFSGYRRATVLRRVRRRMRVRRVDTLEAYADCLLTTPDEFAELLSDVLISVTRFFRDPGAYEALARHAVRPLFEDLDSGRDETLRAWSVGCATGEEAYSLAILLHEEAARRRTAPRVQIFATDIDENALAKARLGRYARSIEAEVSPERLARFFIDEGSHYRVRGELRESVLFASHSVIKDPPFLRLDLVSCRNLLIYLERSLQQQLCSIFHYALKPARYLLLGSAETTDVAAQLFSPLEREARLYRVRAPPARTAPALPQSFSPERIAAPAAFTPPRTERAEAPAAQHVLALERSAPASALVDERHNILHLSPGAGRFILHSAGPVSGLLSAVVRPELRLDLRLALTSALERKEPVLTPFAVVAFEGAKRRVALYVAPAGGQMATGGQAAAGAQALVCFLEGGEAADAERPGTEPDDRSEEVRRLQGEVKSAQEDLFASRSGHDAAIQALRAANEELQLINEEYRSTAEELETSKEELQSINEELHSVNAELKAKLASISLAHNDLQNLTTATEIGTLFLDADLRIKMFTQPIADLFNVTKTDIGRALADFTHRLDYTGVEADARRVLKDLTSVETEVRSQGGQWYLVRMRPYRTLEDRIEGTVVTFVNNTARRQAETALRYSEGRLRTLVEGMPQMVWRASAQGLWSWASPQWRDYSGQSPDASEALGWLDVVHPDDREATRQAWRDAPAHGSLNVEQRLLRAGDGAWRWHQTRAAPVRYAPHENRAQEPYALDAPYTPYAPDAPDVEWLGATTDIDDLKRLQRQQAVLVAELQHRTRNLLAVVRNIAGRSIPPSPERDDYDARLAALGRVQGFLSRSPVYSARLLDVVEAEMHALGDRAADKLHIAGPAVELPGESVQAVALALHELATNAGKYGAIAQASGRLAVVWRLEGDDAPRLVVDWRETGVRLPDGAPTRQGYGTELITQALPYQLRAETALAFLPDGLHCRITLPAGAFSLQAKDLSEKD